MQGRRQRPSHRGEYCTPRHRRHLQPLLHSPHAVRTRRLSYLRGGQDRTSARLIEGPAATRRHGRSSQPADLADELLCAGEAHHLAQAEGGVRVLQQPAVQHDMQEVAAAQHGLRVEVARGDEGAVLDEALVKVRRQRTDVRAARMVEERYIHFPRVPQDKHQVRVAGAPLVQELLAAPRPQPLRAALQLVPHPGSQERLQGCLVVRQRRQRRIRQGLADAARALDEVRYLIVKDRLAAFSVISLRRQGLQVVLIAQAELYLAVAPGKIPPAVRPLEPAHSRSRRPGSTQRAAVSQ
eukprot:scaffold1531_cov296-Prasinococcus_capsulatus_cf.AAC.14